MHSIESCLQSQSKSESRQTNFFENYRRKHPPFEDVSAKPCTPVQPTKDSTEASYDDELLEIFLEGVDDDR